jgi:hypothetical protein
VPQFTPDLPAPVGGDGKQGEQHLMGGDARSAGRRGCRVLAARGGEHGGDQVGTGAPGVAGLDQSWIDVEETMGRSCERASLSGASGGRGVSRVPAGDQDRGA